MGNRIKEEEKIERIIRSLLKLPENKRCINCNSLGPQYVCTTFLTFVCTNCSGVHREFTHRVKSVSMAKFTAEEVNSLQAGGNERARQIYFKEFDPQYHSFPDGSNIGRLRDFIKHMYVERKYTGEKGVQKLPKLRLSEEPDESRRVGAYHGGSRSFHDEEKKFGGGFRSFSDAPYVGRRSFRDEDRKVAAPYGGSRSFREEDWKVAVPSGGSRSFRDEDWKVAAPYGGSRSFHDHEKRFERHYSQGSSPTVRGADQNVVKYYYDERRSPRSYEENSRIGGTGFRRNPVRFEVVDNRIRDDRKARSGLTPPKSQNRSPENKNMDSFSSPAVRSVQEKQRENMLPPMFRETTITNDQKHADGSAHNQKMKSTSPHDGNAVEHKKEKLGSLIDFNTDPERSDDVVKSQQQQTPPPDNGNNWASFDSSTKEKAPPVPKPDTLEALLLELTPTSVPDTASEAPSNDDAPSTTCTNNMPAGGAVPGAPAEQMLSLFDTVSACTSASTSTSVPVQPSNADPLQAVPTSGGDTLVTVTDAQQLPSTQQDQSSISFAADSGSPSQHAIIPVEASNNLSRTSSLAPNTQGSLSVSAEEPSQSMLRTQSLPVETKSSKREELPVDLFAAHYSSIPSQASVWHPGPTRGMGFNMQYYPNIAPAAPAFPGSGEPANPFDINDDKTLGHSTHFPSMSSLEDALHNVSVSPSLMHTSSLGSFSSYLKPPQLPNHESVMPSHSLPSYSAFSPSPYMGEQLHNNAQFLRPQGIGGFNRDEASDTQAFGTLSSSQQSFQQPSIRYPAPSNSETFSSMGGNPFG
ncbi:putative ADP-ribosylation factor GTPase-activating protein AGD14 [Rosa sericea]